MNEKEIEKLRDSIIEKLSLKIEEEMENKTKRGFAWIKILIGSLITLFIAFVGLAINNMIALSSFRENVSVAIADIKNKEDRNSENIKILRIELAIPVQLGLAKSNMAMALLNKDMNAYYKYSDMVTNLELELLKLKYPQEQTRGTK